jgi:putative membrane protein
MIMMGTAVMGWFWIWPTLVVIGLILLDYLAFRLASGRGRRSHVVARPL